MLCGNAERVFLPAARAQTACFYLVAAFWKLTTSFFDYKTSCASILFAELAATLVPDSLLPAGGAAAEIVLRAAPALTAILEGAIGPLLVLMPPLGILFGLAFHLMINVLPLNCTCTSCVILTALVWPPGLA